MKLKLFFTLIILLFFQCVFSQKNMVQGYIIKENGDSVRGKVDDGFWNKNPVKIKFSTSDTDMKMYDVVKELQGFGINGKSDYLRKKITIDVTPYENNTLLETSERTIISDTTLMVRCLVRGKINLYFLRDNESKPHFFVEKSNYPLVELTKHTYIKIVGGRKIIANENLYNNQLAIIFGDDSFYENRTLNLEYTEPSLSGAVSGYNKRVGGGNTPKEAKSEKLLTTIFLQIGVGQYGYITNYETAFNKYTFQKPDIIIPSLGIKGLLNYETPNIPLPPVNKHNSLNFPGVIPTYFLKIIKK